MARCCPTFSRILRSTQHINIVIYNVYTILYYIYKEFVLCSVITFSFVIADIISQFKRFYTVYNKKIVFFTLIFFSK